MTVRFLVQTHIGVNMIVALCAIYTLGMLISWPRFFRCAWHDVLRKIEEHNANCMVLEKLNAERMWQYNQDRDDWIDRHPSRLYALKPPRLFDVRYREACTKDVVVCAWVSWIGALLWHFFAAFWAFSLVVIKPLRRIDYVGLANRVAGEPQEIRVLNRRRRILELESECEISSEPD